MPHNVEKMTNLEFINWLMQYSNQGALSQIFIIQAIDKYCELIINNDLVFPKNHIIHEDAWMRCAIEIKSRIDRKYVPKKEGESVPMENDENESESQGE